MPGLVISDVRMPGMDGLQLLTLLRQRAPEVDVILMTAYEDLPTVATAMREGAVDFLSSRSTCTSCDSWSSVCSMTVAPGPEWSTMTRQVQRARILSDWTALWVGTPAWWRSSM